MVLGASVSWLCSVRMVRSSSMAPIRSLSTTNTAGTVLLITYSTLTMQPAGTGFSQGKKALDYEERVRSPRICGTLCLRSTQCTLSMLN